MPGRFEEYKRIFFKKNAFPSFKTYQCMDRIEITINIRLKTVLYFIRAMKNRN